MNYRHYFIDTLGLILCAILINSSAPQLALNCLLSVLAVSVLYLIESSFIKVLIACLIIIVTSLAGPIYLIIIPVFYVLASIYGYWTFIALLICGLLFQPSFSNLIVLLLSIHIATLRYQNTLVSRQLNVVRDKLVGEKLQLKAAKKAMETNHHHALELAILSERNRIASSLHDTLGHTLARSIIQLEALLTVYSDNALTKQLLQLQQTLTDGMDEIRQTIHQIHHQSLNLNQTIDQLQEEFAPLRIHYRSSLNSELPAALTRDLVTIIRECIINTVKHSNSNEVNIIIHEFPQHIKVVIKDNGSIAPSSNAAGMGLSLIRQIAHHHHASMLTHFHNGFHLQLNIPTK